MKKILVACRGYYPDIAGGGEISTKLLTEQLSSLGYEVEVLAVSDADYKDQVNSIDVNRVKYSNLYWSMKNKEVSRVKKLIWHVVDSNNISFANKIGAILEKVKPEIFITSTIEDISSLAWKIAKEKGIRTIHILRSYTLLCVNANMYKEDNCGSQCGLCKSMTILKKSNSKYVDDVVGISRFVLDEHIRSGYFKNAQQHVIYNICLEDVLKERQYNGFNGKIINFGYLGRVHKTKGIDLIFAALSKLPDCITKNISLKIAGDGDKDYILHLSDEARKSKLNVEFLGNVPANDFLDCLDLLIVPSKWNEPFGRVIIESMARKVPVAAKEVGGIPELLSDNQGFLFDNEEQLTLLIRNYLESNLHFKFILNNFETKNIVNKWNDLLS
ncbi:glycosyltransferase family 4 protein [Rahnella sp. Lac-M11]|jgi:glycosyltransferase involved in cell wall biosynthesis|uniref:Glycosyltransferase family 4 protein n=1 Tax=Rahnella contaminans TaxID=2703882 RepID=A0A6M2B3K5_9GAMM|nr:MULTISPECIES: glycosyltransferase [Rahnella]NGX87665.1 glycosyltransferase family 4 protein [Rahnella contaminans]